MSKQKNIIEDLKYRGLIKQSTDLDKLEERLRGGSISIYTGFDPTAESIHVGNLLQVLTLKRFQKKGHKVIVLLGGGTALIGDPSGKDKERELSSRKTVKKSQKKIKKQMEKLIDFDSDKTELVNNFEWLKDLDTISFLRDIGKSFSVNSMIRKESVQSRLETGISFTEFSYQILQSFDYLKLFKKFGCCLQIGGSDQWGNITAGVDFIRKKEETQVHGLTLPLLTKADGKKFGKTESGTIWLDKKKTSPFDFYQFWINQPDDQVIKLLKFFTFLSEEEIEKLKQKQKKDPAQRPAQKKLAYEVTAVVHGEKTAKKTKKISQALFGKDTQDLTKEELKDIFNNVSIKKIEKKKMKITDLLKKAEVVPSKRQAREDIKNGAVSFNGEKIENKEKEINLKEGIYKNYSIIKRGKKDYYFVREKS